MNIRLLILLFIVSDSLQGGFPIHEDLKPMVDFWDKIFSYYSSQTAVIHDREDLRLIIDHVRISPLIKDPKKHVEGYIQRYKQAIENLKKNKNLKNLDPLEKRIYQIFQKYPENMPRLLKGDIYLRCQWGLADEFSKAIQRATPYLPFMEKIFLNKGLPKELTRLPFVESMFQEKAFSKVGAAGLWQIMPSAAMNHLKIDQGFDERISPYKATILAAKILANSHKDLGSWPLAITAYNYGLNGVKNAINKTKSKEIHIILKRYRASQFGFASRNFYAEFLAALRVFERKKRSTFFYQDNPIPITLPQSMTLADFLKKTGLKGSFVERFNPCLKKVAFLKPHEFIIPENYKMYFPRTFSKKIRKIFLKKEFLS